MLMADTSACEVCHEYMIAVLFAGLCSVALAEPPVDSKGAAEPIAVFIGGTGVPDAVLAEMRQEVELSIRQASIRISWQSLNGPRYAIDFPDLVVIRMVGNCSATPGKLEASEE